MHTRAKHLKNVPHLNKNGHDGLVALHKSIGEYDRFRLIALLRAGTLLAPSTGLGGFGPSLFPLELVAFSITRQQRVNDSNQNRKKKKDVSNNNSPQRKPHTLHTIFRKWGMEYY